MLTGIDLTFDLLSRTQNEAAAYVLAPALESDSQEMRMRAAHALLQREDVTGVQLVLQALPRLGDEGWEAIKAYPAQVAAALHELKADPGQHEFILQVVERLQLKEAILDVIDLSLENESFSLRRDATNTALKLCWAVSEPERKRSDRSPLRVQVLQRLSDALRVDPAQLSLTLVDAFLSIVRWDDGILKTFCEQEDKLTDVLADRLMRSRAPGVIHLLAHWIDRPRLPKIAQEALSARADQSFIEVLLLALGANPSSNAISHISRLRPLAGLNELSRSWKSFDKRHVAAIVRAVALNEIDGMRVVRLIFEVLDESSNEQTEQVAHRVMSELPSFDAELVMRAALADGNDDDSHLDPAVKTVSRLLDLAQNDGPLMISARRLLSSLQAQSLLDRIDHLTESTSARLGKVIRALDTDSQARVEALLRHSVGRFRLRGIRGAIALGFLDEMPDTWVRMFQGLAADHQESRLAAVHALRMGTGENSIRVLQKLVKMTTGVVLEAAERALADRLHELEQANILEATA